MDKDMLFRVQKEQLEIAKEIKRICDKNNIKYFLDSGTLIGAVRHKGFIPWDDDIDIGMIREEYDKFNSIAPKELKPEYYWQTWLTDDEYARPFGKVRKRNTIYVEEGVKKITNNGFYVDVFPFDFAPNDELYRKRLIKQRVYLQRILLMKHGYKLWSRKGAFDIKKFFGYMPYKCLSLFYSHNKIVQKYEKIIRCVSETDYMYEQIGKKNTHYYKKEWLNEVVDMKFEDESFSVPIGTHERLSEEYGDYMKLPPEDQRENRHCIIEIKF